MQGKEEDPQAPRRCLRCSGTMKAGFVNAEQQTFPLEWVELIEELNGPEGENVYGVGERARRSRELRDRLDASRRRVTAFRCAGCGSVELVAASRQTNAK